MDNQPALRSIDWDGLTHARRALIGNPYATPVDDLCSGRIWFFENASVVPTAVLELCERMLTDDARKVALGFAHAAAQRDCVESLLPAVERAVAAAAPHGLRLVPADLRRLAKALERFEKAVARLIGTSAATRRLKEKLWTACFGPNLYETLDSETAIRKQNILILGAPGTGKEVVAEVIQAAALVADPSRAPAQTVNCPALPSLLAEAELFGAEKGAHSAAHKRRQGRISAANNGTLFLDEVADLPLDVQAKLLAVIENGKVTPLGTNDVERVSVRYIAATSRPLREMVKDGTFRDDLFGRLAGTIITIPTLAERPEDIVAIGEAFLEQIRPKPAPAAPTQRVISNVLGSLGSITDHWLQSTAPTLPWTGNVRELQAVLREMVLGFKSPSHSQEAQPLPSAAATRPPSVDVPLNILECRATLKEVTAWYIARVVDSAGGNLSEAQRRLRSDRGTIRRHLEKVVPPKKDGAA